MTAPYFHRKRPTTLPPKWDPRRQPYAARLQAATTAMRAGHFDVALDHCAAIEAEHGQQPWTQMLAMLIVKDRLGEKQSALEGARHIAKTWPSWVDAQYNLGAFLQEMGDWQGSLWHLRKALQIDEHHVQAMVQLGISYTALGQHEAADRVWDRALEYAPATVREEYQLGPIFAARGNMEHFMRLQELRWEAQDHYQHDHGAPPGVMAHAAIWQGEPLTGKSVLVLDEQGAGDVIQFARWLPLLTAEASHVFLRLKSPALRTLVAAIAPDVQILAHGEPLPLCDYVVGLMSLFHRFGMVRKAQPAFPQHYVPRPRHAPIGRPTIVLCWAGATSHPRDAQRSMTWDDARTLVDALPHVRWIDGTVGRERPEDERCPPMPRGDYLATRDVLSEADLLITVDTSIAHLAGAMGVPTWTLVTTLPDMRWGLGVDTTPWYESWRIWRQTQPNDWGTVLGSIVQELRALYPAPEEPA